MFKKVLILCLALAVPFLVMAQSSGKIIGIVTDKETGEPLPGVNVILQGTYLGATTDIDGYFVVLNIPVGQYTLEASYVGYTKMVVQGVGVSANITSETNFQLQPTTLELGEAVVVIAERPLVEKFVTQSISKVTAEDLENIAVRGANNILALQPSVVVQDGNVHIRGGRADEVGYYLDGASTNNPLNNLNNVNVIQEAVEEVQVLTGGYTAEFGNANAGIVRSELKTGGSKFHFSVDAQTDKFASEGESFLDTYSYREHLIVATASGPITDNIRFFAAFENLDEGDRRKRFSTGYTFDETNLTNPLIDRNPSNAFAGDTLNSISYVDGFTPKNYLQRYTGNATLLFDFDNIKFRVSGLYTFSKDYQLVDPMRDVLNTREFPRETNTMLLGAKFTHVLNPTTFYNVKVNYYSDFDERTDDWFGNSWRSWEDSAKVSDYTNGAVTYRGEYDAPYSYYVNGFNFFRDGTVRFNYSKNSQTYIGGALDFVSQVGQHHELRAGVDGRQYTIRRYLVDPGAFMKLAKTNGGEQNIPEANLQFILGSRNYGYDSFGNDLDSGVDAAKKPVFLSAYVQDKIEYKDLIINAGLRMDYFDTKDRYIENPANLQKDKVTGLVKEEEWKDVDPFMFVSPRLGVSFPVSDQTVFYAQYGQFVQMPEFNSFYFSQYQYGRQIGGGNFFSSPIGFNIEPMNTTSYEIGFRQQVSDFAAFDITGFYKNVKGQIQADRVVPEPGAEIQSYNVLTNGDFATTSGLEFKLTLRRINRLQAQMNYTYTSAEGTGSGRTSYISAVDRISQRPSVLQPLDFNQTHRGTINLDYRFGDNDGGPVFQNFGINGLFTFNSGRPYTIVYTDGGQSGAWNMGSGYMDDTRSRQALEPINASLTPWQYNVDLRIDKSFNIVEDLMATVYVRVLNLFNTKNVQNVYQATGSAQDDGWLSGQLAPDRFQTIAQEAVGAGGDPNDYIQMYQAINNENGQAYWWEVGNQVYLNPRQIFVGIKLSY